MKKRPSKWLIGCGIGCGAVLLVLIVVFGASFFFLRSTFRGIQEAAESHDRLVAAGGEVGDYVPPADGAVPPDRMEVFLSVRQSLMEPQARTEAVLAGFPPEGARRREDGFLKAFSILRGLTGMISPIGEYVDQRNEALLEAGMGIGEYVYVYSTAYYSWLGESPEDGPVVAGDAVGRGKERLFDGREATFGARKVRRRFRRHMLSLLGNQLRSLPESPGGSAATTWRAALEAEIERLRLDTRAVPWEEGLPPAIEASLAPYRDRLEATYHATTNCFEMPMSEGEGWNRWSD